MDALARFVGGAGVRRRDNVVIFIRTILTRVGKRFRAFVTVILNPGA